MGLYGKLIVLVSVAVFISPFVAAQEFTASSAVRHQEVSPSDGEVPLFDITVANNDTVSHYFTLKLQSSDTWYNGPYPRTFTLDPGKTKTSTVYVKLDSDAVAGAKGVNIYVTSDTGERQILRPSFRIKRNNTVIIKSFGTDNDTYVPGSTVTASVRVRNVVNHELAKNEYHAVFSFNGKQKTVPFLDLNPGEEQTATATFPIGAFDSGVKNVGVVVEDLNGNVQQQKTAKVTISQVKNIETTRKSNFQGISSTTVLTAENRGNVAADNTVMHAHVPTYLSYFVSFETTPSTSTQNGGAVTYTWELGSLKPGEKRVVTYHVNYWTPLAIILVIIIAVILGVRELRSPRITKKTVRKNEKHAVHITVKNRSGHVMDNVVVKDFIPSIANLIEKFDSSPPEKIRQGEEGTDIEWKLGRMNPGEERILTYKISPQVSVEGNVTLPSARLEYKSGDAEKKRSSHHTNADFR